MLGLPGLLGVGQRLVAEEMEREALELARMSRGVHDYAGRIKGGLSASGTAGSGGSTGIGGHTGGGHGNTGGNAP